jgi:membrane protease subunit HflK
MTESAVRETVGKSKMDFVLTEGRNEVAVATERLLQSMLDELHTGLEITSVNMQDVQPPEQVQAAFADVVKAREDRERSKNKAEAYANDIVPKARGAAFRIIQEAEAYKSEVIAKANGETSRFLQVMEEYQKAPEITGERLYLESMESVYSKSNKVMVDISEDNNSVLYLPLDRMRSGSTVPNNQLDSGNMKNYSQDALSAAKSAAGLDARSRGGR